jgi:hypothetical protein
MKENDRVPCTSTDCEFYNSDGSHCIEIDCKGRIGTGITVEDLFKPHIAGGRRGK